MNGKVKIWGSDKDLHIDDFYLTFKQKLEEIHTFPSDYIFKFILSSEQGNIEKVHSIFANANANFLSKESKNGKYSSITVKATVCDADDVIIYYRQVAAIDGVMML